MRRYIFTSLAMFVVLSVLLGVLYPLAVFGIGQVAFKKQADGSLITRDGQVVGSKLLAEDFTSPQYFHPRPSKAGTGYDGNGYDGVRERGVEPGTVEPEAHRQRPGRQHRRHLRTRTRRPSDPTCLPVQATDKDGNDVTDNNGNPVYEKNKDGTLRVRPRHRCRNGSLRTAPRTARPRA